MIFRERGFTQGQWTSALLNKLPSDLIPEWTPRPRLWRASWTQWVQFEPTGWPGPKFYLAKPAIKALEDGFLYTGLYVERGYPPDAAPTQITPGTVMDSSWHWHGLVALWKSCSGRGALHSRLEGLSGACAVIDYTNGTDLKVLPQIPLSAVGSYADVLAAIATVPPHAYINLVVGVSISKTRCLSDQEAMLPEFRNPLVRAWQLHEIVQAATPRAASH